MDHKHGDTRGRDKRAQQRTHKSASAKWALKKKTSAHLLSAAMQEEAKIAQDVERETTFPRTRERAGKLQVQEAAELPWTTLEDRASDPGPVSSEDVSEASHSSGTWSPAFKLDHAETKVLSTYAAKMCPGMLVQYTRGLTPHPCDSLLQAYCMRMAWDVAGVCPPAVRMAQWAPEAAPKMTWLALGGQEWPGGEFATQCTHAIDRCQCVEAPYDYIITDLGTLGPEQLWALAYRSMRQRVVVVSTLACGVGRAASGETQWYERADGLVVQETKGCGSVVIPSRSWLRKGWQQGERSLNAVTYHESDGYVVVGLSVGKERRTPPDDKAVTLTSALLTLAGSRRIDVRVWADGVIDNVEAAEVCNRELIVWEKGVARPKVVPCKYITQVMLGYVSSSASQGTTMLIANSLKARLREDQPEDPAIIVAYAMPIGRWLASASVARSQESIPVVREVELARQARIADGLGTWWDRQNWWHRSTLRWDAAIGPFVPTSLLAVSLCLLVAAVWYVHVPRYRLLGPYGCVLENRVESSFTAVPMLDRIRGCAPQYYARMAQWVVDKVLYVPEELRWLGPLLEELAAHFFPLLRVAYVVLDVVLGPHSVIVYAVGQLLFHVLARRVHPVVALMTHYALAVVGYEMNVLRMGAVAPLGMVWLWYRFESHSVKTGKYEQEAMGKVGPVHSEKLWIRDTAHASVKPALQRMGPVVEHRVPVVPASSANNSATAMVERLFPDRGRLRFMAAYREVCKLPDGGAGYGPVPMAEWMRHLRPGQRRLVAAAQQQHQTAFPRRWYYTHRFFVKHEKLAKLTGEGLPRVVPRGIENCSPLLFRALGPKFYAYAKYVARLYDWGSRVYYPLGASAEDMSTWMQREVDRLGPTAVWYDIDRARFDGRVKPALLRAEMDLMATVLPKKFRYMIRRLVYRRKTRDAYGNSASLVGRVITGYPGTSVINFLLCLHAQLAHLRPTGFDYSIMALGDDMVLGVVGVYDPGAEASYGFKPKIMRSRDPFACAFLSALFVPVAPYEHRGVWADRLLTSKPGRQLLKFGWDITMAPKPAGIMRSVAIARRQDWAHCPGLWALAQRAYDDTEGVRAAKITRDLENRMRSERVHSSVPYTSSWLGNHYGFDGVAWCAIEAEVLSGSGTIRHAAALAAIDVDSS